MSNSSWASSGAAARSIIANGEHDDWANAVAGCVSVLLQPQQEPWVFRSGGVTIGAPLPTPLAEPVEEEVEPEPSLVAQAATTLRQGVDTVTHAVTSAKKAVTRTLSKVPKVIENPTPPCEPFPLQGGRKRTLAEIESLSEGCRSLAEQKRLDEEHARRARHRQPSALEAQVKRNGVYWPDTDPLSRQQAIERIIALWR